MKKTRNLFVLLGNATDVSKVLEELDYKGATTFPYDVRPSPDELSVAYWLNKSVICSISDATDIESPYPPIFVYVNPSGDETPAIKTNDGNIRQQFETICDTLNLEVGDHRSNSSGLNGAPTIADCAYCKYLAGDPHDNERTVYKSKYFFVIPTIGEFIKGYLLVIPYRHIMSNAELTPEEVEDFKNTLEDVEYLLKITYDYPNYLVWENGSGSGGIGKAKDSIVHSHVHIAPSNLTLEDIEKESGFPFKPVTLDELCNYGQESYLLIRDPSMRWIIDQSGTRFIPRQYIRQLLGEEHGIPGEQWNWRKYPFHDLLHETTCDIEEAIKANWDSLPERVKKNLNSMH